MKPRKPKTKPKPPLLPDAELKQIAIDIRAGRIFCNWHCEDEEEVLSVFLFLRFASKKNIADLQRDPPGLVYEYLCKAAPISINGMPRFLSGCFLSQANTNLVRAYIKKLEAAEAAVA